MKIFDHVAVALSSNPHQNRHHQYLKALAHMYANARGVKASLTYLLQLYEYDIELTRLDTHLPQQQDCQLGPVRGVMIVRYL